jgi:predicted RND superfamily exporter protein
MPVAVAGCLALLLVWMRSLPLAVATVVPILLVVSWLYAFMYLAGYHLNFVTATIGAVSAGVGIDYSIYQTQRFRQELARQAVKGLALAAALQGAGPALAGAAASSVLGFAVLAFSPMPLFASYGVLTAAMILMSLAACLLVLPCLLLMAAPPRRGQAGVL